MSTYTLQQRVFIVEEYFKNNCSPVCVKRAFQLRFNVRVGPSAPTVNRIVELFRRTGSVQDEKRQRRPTVSTEENIERTRQVFAKSPQKSLRRAAQQLDVSRETVRKIVKTTLKLFPYKIQTFQPMKAENEEKRVMFANQLICNIDDGVTDLGSIWFSDEAHFHLDGYVNKQNWRFWANENPHVAVQKSLHPKRVTVWCGLSKKSIIGPIFIHETVKSGVYLNILQNSFIPEIKKFHDWQSFWFQQDGATPHRTDVIFQTLRDTFEDRIIALDCQKFNCNGIEWPP